MSGEEVDVSGLPNPEMTVGDLILDLPVLRDMLLELDYDRMPFRNIVTGEVIYLSNPAAES